MCHNLKNCMPMCDDQDQYSYNRVFIWPLIRHHHIDSTKQRRPRQTAEATYYSVSQNVTNLILNNFYKLEPISIIFVSRKSLAGFRYKSQLYFFAEPSMNLLYLAISHSGVNDVSPLRHLFHRAWSTKPLISGVPGCVHVLRLKLATIWTFAIHLCWFTSWSNRLFSEPLTDFRGRHYTESLIFLWFMF